MLKSPSRVAVLTLAIPFFGSGLALRAAAQEHDHDHPRAEQQHSDHVEQRAPGRGPVQGPAPAPAQSTPRAPEAPRGPAPGFRPHDDRPHEGTEHWREPDGRGRVLDNRYNHGHYYPEFGTFRRDIPPDYHPYYHNGSRFFFSGGIWYAPRAEGFVVVRPPVGLTVAVLPPYYSTLWFGGTPYYYANDVYYTWQPELNGYVVVDPPDNADQPSTPPGDSYDDLIIYPKNGQSNEQQAADRYECHNWAKGQTGFDPTQPGGGVAGDVDRIRNNYNRAMSACLQARGYEVK